MIIIFLLEVFFPKIPTMKTYKFSGLPSFDASLVVAILTVRKLIAPTITDARPADTQDLANLKNLTIKCWLEVQS